jgi:cytoskeletal protein CcmA (bactofilin family)
VHNWTAGVAEFPVQRAMPEHPALRPQDGARSCPRITNGSSHSGEEARHMLFNRKTGSETGRWPAYSFEPDTRAAPRKTGGARAQSVIDATLAIVGDLQTAGDLQVDGHICGNVECAQLVVGRNAAITGAIRAAEAVIRGRIMGTISANVIILQGTAHVEADVVYGQLAIDEGAEFEGAARRSERPLEEAARSAMADLKRMIPAPGGGKAPPAKGANGHGAGTEQPSPAEAGVSACDGCSQEEPGFGDRGG